ncbi:MAG: hypothetical protein Q7R47_03925 [Candidatus Diapherotrites archaeon]|nr:hypothetical protein [Candidatus Diapherotrites archaeon]
MVDSKQDWRVKGLLLVLFLVAYAICALLGVVVLQKWDSPLHWLIPIPAFFLAFWLFGWIDEEFGVSKRSLAWPVAIAVLGMVAFFVAQLVYWCNGLTDIVGANSTCSSDGMNKAFELMGGQWQDLFLRDGYSYFLLMVLLAWVSLQVIESLSPSSGAKHKKAEKKKGEKK